MASTDPSFISDPREQKWVREINEILNHQLQINTNKSPPTLSIFQIPESITTKKPAAYEPQHIGLGPNHHFRPRPYIKMEQKKLLVVQRVLQYHKIKDFRTSVVDKVQKHVPVIRGCYEMFLPHDNMSMSWVFAIDGLFLLDLFQNYPTDGSLTQDIMMLDNQIPFMVLKEIDQALHKSSSTKFLSRKKLHHSIGTMFSPSSFRSFCVIHSPFQLCSELQAPTHVEHLLDYMYHSIIYDRPPGVDRNSYNDTFNGGSSSFRDISTHHSLIEIIINAVKFIKRVPHKEIVQAYKQIIAILENFGRYKVTFPSASKLEGIAGFWFHHLPEEEEDIGMIRINGNTFYLPCLTLNNDSEVILRNLVAYEMLKPKSIRFPLSEYVGLMCDLVLNVDDVRILKKENIIKGALSDDEVAKIFVGMSSCIPRLQSKVKSRLQDTIDEVNKVYQSTLILRGYLSLSKLANWLLVVLRRIDRFVRVSWKILAFMISILTALMLTYQAYCVVCGCDSQTVKLLKYQTYYDFYGCDCKTVKLLKYASR